MRAVGLLLVMGLGFAPAMAESPTMKLMMSEPDALFDARRMMKAGDHEAAIRRLENTNLGKFSERHYAVANNLLCVSYMELARYQSAEQACEEALEAAPNYWRHKNNLAAVYINQRRYEEAVELLEQTIERHGEVQTLIQNLRLAQRHLELRG